MKACSVLEWDLIKGCLTKTNTEIHTYLYRSRFHRAEGNMYNIHNSHITLRLTSKRQHRTRSLRHNSKTSVMLMFQVYNVFFTPKNNKTELVACVMSRAIFFYLILTKSWPFKPKIHTFSKFLSKFGFKRSKIVKICANKMSNWSHHPKLSTM